MTWFTVFGIKIELKEFLLSAFADKIDKLYEDVTIKDKEVSFALTLQKGRLEDLKKLLEDVSYLFDGMFWRITGTLRGKDEYAEEQLQGDSNFGNTTCRKVEYFVYKDPKGCYILMIHEIYDPQDIITISLDKDSKRRPRDIGLDFSLYTDDDSMSNVYDAIEISSPVKN